MDITQSCVINPADATNRRIANNAETTLWNKIKSRNAINTRKIENSKSEIFILSNAA